MKVGFDLSQIAHVGGVGVYTKNLAEHLSDIPNLDMKFFYSSLRKPYRGNFKNVKTYPIPPTILELLFNQLRVFSIENLIGDVDIFHSSDWIQPPTKAKKVTTYHDVIPLKYPQWSHPKIVAVHRRRLEIIEKEIDMVIAVSKATKNDLLEVSSLPGEKIKVIYEGVNDEFKPQDKVDIEKFRNELKLPKDFILAIGGVGERRNLERVKEAAKNYNLVITGQTIPYLKPEWMPLLFAAAQVLLYPSLYEGFGLPVLEAMAVGTPVVTASVSSIPEVGAEAVLYVDPLSVEDIKRGLKEVIHDSDLRKMLIKRGQKRANNFSWEKCAKETALIYRHLL